MLLLDGNALSKTIKTEIKSAVDAIRESGKRVPHLVAVMVGENPASASYVRNKIKSCEQVGFRSTMIHRDVTATQADILEVVAALNADPEVDGFIVQLPLPKHIDEQAINLAIDPRKDVDGFHPTNIGRMVQSLPTYLPATPYGILLMLERYNIATAGKHCVVVGRSNIVGTPISILLSRKGNPGDCTVTLTHSRTTDLPSITRQADILIAAIGIPNFVTVDMVKPGAVIIDVGINRIEDPTTKSGYRLIGDADFDAIAPIASAITPVPGGVGPMTVTCLMLNTLRACRREVYG